MVTVFEITETTLTTKEIPSQPINDVPKNGSSLPVVRAENFSGRNHKLVQTPHIVRHLKFIASPSFSLIKHLARTNGEDHGISAEMGAIVPYVPKIPEEDHFKTRLYAFLSSTLKEEMQRHVSELKSSIAMEASGKIPKDAFNVAPLASFKIPDGSQNGEQTYSLVLAQRRRIPTICLGERLFSFTFPRQFISNDKQVDDLIVNEMGRQYTFSERLRGWKIDRRQRINGRIDLNYYHLMSQTSYRSTRDVLNFLLLEYRNYRGKNSGGENTAASVQKSVVELKRIICSSSDAESSRKMKQKIEYSHVESDAEKFCRESHANRRSIPNPSRVYRSESEFDMLSAEERREEVEKFLSDSFDNMGKSIYV